MLRQIPFFGTIVDFLVWGISAFDGKDIAFFFALLILGGSIVAGALIWRYFHHPFVGGLKRATKELSDIAADKALAPGDRLARGNEILARSLLLKEAWKQYSLDLQPDVKHGFVNLIDPRSWFAVDTLPGHGYEKWAGTLSGVFLTIGLLFTFVGLSAALFQVGEAGTDPKAMQEAIKQVLSISSAKFITSIAGIVAYIQWSLTARYYQRAQSRAASGFAAGVQALSRYVTPEILLFEQSNLARKQLERLDRFTDDLAIAVDRSLERTIGVRLDQMPMALGEAVRPTLDAAFKPVVDAVTGFGTNAGKMNEQAFQGMLESIMSGVKDATAEEKKTAGNASAEAARMMESIKNQLDTGSKNFGDKMDRAADRLLEAAEKMDATFTNNVRTLGDGVDRFGQVGRQISGDVAAGLKIATETIIDAARRSGDETSKGLREQVGALTAAMAHIGIEVSAAIDKSRKGIEDGSAGAAVALGEGATVAAARIVGAAEKMEATFTSNVRALENGVDRLTDALDGSVDRFGQVGRQISEDVAAGLKVATDAIINAAQRTGTEVSAAIDKSRKGIEDGSAGAAAVLDKGAAVAAARIVGAADALGAGIGVAAAGLESLSVGTDAQTARLDAAGRRIVEASEAFGTAGAAVRDAVTPVAQSLQSIEASLTQVRQAVEAHRELDATVRDSLDRLSTLARQTNDMFAAHEQRLGQLDGALGQTIEGVRSGVQQISQTMAEAFRDYDHHMAKAIGSLSNAVENFAEQIDDARRAPARI